MQIKSQLNKPFNFYKDGLDLEFLRVYCIDHGKTRIMKRGETFEEVGTPSQYVAYVERGYFKYMVHNDEEGKDYCSGFAFEGEFVANYPNCLSGKNQRQLLWSELRVRYFKY